MSDDDFSDSKRDSSPHSAPLTITLHFRMLPPDVNLDYFYCCGRNHPHAAHEQANCFHLRSALFGILFHVKHVSIIVLKEFTWIRKYRRNRQRND
jgi:hypothetical protein